MRHLLPSEECFERQTERRSCVETGQAYRTDKIALGPVRRNGVHAADLSTNIIDKALQKDDFAFHGQDTRTTTVESKATATS